MCVVITSSCCGNMKDWTQMGQKGEGQEGYISTGPNLTFRKILLSLHYYFETENNI